MCNKNNTYIQNQKEQLKLLGHIMRKQSLANLTLTEHSEGLRATYLMSLCERMAKQETSKGRNTAKGHNRLEGTDHLLKGHNTNNNKKNIFSLGYVMLILYLTVAKIVLSHRLSYSFRGYFLHGYHAIMGAWPNGCNSCFTILKHRFDSHHCRFGGFLLIILVWN